MPKEAKKKHKSKPAKKPKQQEIDLGSTPGVQPTGNIKELNTAAEEYAEARDVRMDATKDEVRTKKRLEELLKKHEKEIGRDPTDHALRYQHENVSIELLPIDEKLTVKVLKVEEPEAGD